MSQDITTRPVTSSITGVRPAEPRTAALTSYLGNNLEPIPGSFSRYALSAAHAPTDEHRALLMARRDGLDAALLGADPETIRECVGSLRAVMASQPLGPEAMKLARAAFVSVLGRYPAWAVREAAERFLDGRAGSGTYAPTPAEMAAVCRTLTADALHERARINAILDAEVYAAPTEADRKAMQERYDAFVAETVARATAKAKPGPTEPTGTDAPDKARARAVLDEMDEAARAEAEARASIEAV